MCDSSSCIMIHHLIMHCQAGVWCAVQQLACAVHTQDAVTQQPVLQTICRLSGRQPSFCWNCIACRHDLLCTCALGSTVGRWLWRYLQLDW